MMGITTEAAFAACLYGPYLTCGRLWRSPHDQAHDEAGEASSRGACDTLAVCPLT
jgi:hypothetical protein